MSRSMAGGAGRLRRHRRRGHGPRRCWRRRRSPAAPRRATLVSGMPSRSMLALRRTSLTPPATTGVGMAVEPSGGTAWAVRSAFLGVAVGVMGLIALVVFVASVDALVDSPERYGSPFDASVSGFSGDVLEEGGVELLADPRAAKVGYGFGGLARVGGDEVNTLCPRVGQGRHVLHAAAGARPSARRRSSSAPARSRAPTPRSGTRSRSKAPGAPLATVVGTAVFPVTDERSSPGRGVLLGREDLESISAGRAERGRHHRVGRRRRSRRGQRGARGRHRDRGVPASPAVGGEQPARCEGAPAALAAFLAILAAWRSSTRWSRRSGSVARTSPSSAPSGSSVDSSGRRSSGRRRRSDWSGSSSACLRPGGRPPRLGGGGEQHRRGRRSRHPRTGGPGGPGRRAPAPARGRRRPSRLARRVSHDGAAHRGLSERWATSVARSTSRP